MVDCIKNLYEILDVPYNADFSEIKAAYKKLVRIYHPDINKSKEAEIKFKLLNNAYEILSDSIKRKNYDSLLNITNEDFREEKEKTAPKKEEAPVFIKKEPNVFEKTPKKDPFIKKESGFFNKETIDNNSIIKEVKITEIEAKGGCHRTVNILNTQKCPKCMGKKFINGVKCGFCLGEGEKKELKQIDVKIEKGVINNTLIYVGKVNKSALYDKKLFLKILIEPAIKIHFEEGNVVVDVETPLYDAILGIKKEINVESIGFVDLEIPPLTKPDTKIKLVTEEGEIFAKIIVQFPNNLTYEEKKLYDKIKLINSEGLR